MIDSTDPAQTKSTDNKKILNASAVLNLLIVKPKIIETC